MTQVTKGMAGIQMKAAAQKPSGSRTTCTPGAVVTFGSITSADFSISGEVDDYSFSIADNDTSVLIYTVSDLDTVGTLDDSSCAEIATGSCALAFLMRPSAGSNNIAAVRRDERNAG